MDNERANAIWTEIQNSLASEIGRKLPGEKTLQEFQSELADQGVSISRDALRRRLNAMVESGELTSRKIMLPGNPAKVVLYSPVNETS